MKENLATMYNLFNATNHTIFYVLAFLEVDQAMYGRGTTRESDSYCYKSNQSYKLTCGYVPFRENYIDTFTIWDSSTLPKPSQLSALVVHCFGFKGLSLTLAIVLSYMKLLKQPTKLVK